VVFLSGVRWHHSRPPNSKPHGFVNFVAFWRRIALTVIDRFYTVSVIFTLQRSKHFIVMLVGGATRSTNCGGNFQKHKRSATELCQILCMVTIEVVINSTHLYRHMCVTISCRSALSRLGWCFWFLVYFTGTLKIISNGRLVFNGDLQAESSGWLFNWALAGHIVTAQV